MNMLTGKSSPFFLGKSIVAGFGLFAKDDIVSDIFVIEYTGEVVSHVEAERRGAFYDYKKLSYLFDLNTEKGSTFQTVDATRIGNESRFINHSVTPNLKARNMMVNGIIRIGFFSSRKIRKGEELFFDYNYNELFKKTYNFREI